MVSVGKTLKRFLHENRWTCFASTRVGAHTAWLPQQANCARRNVGYALYCTVSTRQANGVPRSYQCNSITTAKCERIRMEGTATVQRVTTGTLHVLSSADLTLHYPVLSSQLHCTPYTGSATPPRARALAPNRKTSHAPVKCKGKKYTLPPNALTKRNPPRSICRRLWCILSPGCSTDQSMILRRTTRNSPPPPFPPPALTTSDPFVRNSGRPADYTTKPALYHHAK